MKRRLFTVTKDRRPIALVLARDFSEAVTIAARLGPRNSASAPGRQELWAELRARRPTAAERWSFAVAASRLRGEAMLAALPLEAVT